MLLAVVPIGVAGAALATAAGYILQSVIGIAFFALNRRSTLYFTRPRFDMQALLKACGNGMSEMVGMLVITVTMIAMNVILMNLAGSDGVAAAAVILAAQTILSAAYAGYVQGVAPVVSFHYGGGHYGELSRLYRAALGTIAVMSVVTFAAAFPLARPIARLFAGETGNVVHLSVRGMTLCAAAFLFMGFNLFSSGFFTVLDDGKTSALLALFRTLIFLMPPLLTLPRIWGMDGVWLSMPAAEILGAILSLYRFRRYKNRYHYDDPKAGIPLDTSK